MSCEILKGAPVAAALDEKTKIKVLALEQKGICPCLAILRVGERPDDMAYERAAVKRCEKVGVQVRRIILPEDVSQAELISEIEKLNADSGVHGVLMFRPLPKPLDEKAACLALDPRKDIDGITVGSMSRVFSGSGDGFSPCTAQSVMEILNYYGVEISGKRVAVIGRSLVIGRPAAMLLMAANATVTICHSKTEDMPSVVRDADIVVAAIGKGEAIGAEYLRAGQTVIDVGMNWSEEKQKFVGDVRLDEAEQTVRAVTPVPGGVGSVTTSVLVSHVVEVADR
jgi:methylenetetrahydrofolate dehydrogenase (NADP+) / methenyltetrahydrofolate cyclohydrolase